MELNFKEFGQGDPVIILHGLFGTLDNWQTIAKQLAKNYTVYIVDQRNHGRSPHDDEFSYPIMAEDLQVFMESKWIYKAHIIGHSMGGKTAMEFALNYPDMVDKLVIVDIAPKAYEGGHQIIFDALFSVDLTALTNRKEADEVLAQKIEDYGVRQFLLKNLSRTKEGAYQWKMNLPVIYKHYQAILASISVEATFDKETLFIKGEKSNYIQEVDKETIERYFPKASIRMVEGSGHWVHAEKPKELLDLVLQYFENS